MMNPWCRLGLATVVMASVAGCAARMPKVESSATGVGPSGITVAESAAAEATRPHIALAPREMKWQPFAPGGPGVMIAVLAGDPEKPDPFVLRIKSPAGAKVPPHWHPNDENITIVSGTFALGMGDKFNAKALQVLPPGSYALVPHEMRHFGISKTPTVVQLHGMGPFQIKFVNAADDPRSKSGGR